MKIFVMVDMEGISGIINREQVRSDSKDYEEGRRMLVADVNACVNGCFDGGADSVTVRDAHGTGRNFIWDMLDSRADYIIGSTGIHRGNWRMPGVEEADGLILIGYHAMSETPEAVLAHTWSLDDWKEFKINGRTSGEAAMEMCWSAEYGVPVIMISGDDKTCVEAETFVPGIIKAQVKQSFTQSGARLLSPKNAHELIRVKTIEAIRNHKNIKPIIIEKPVELSLELRNNPIPYIAKGKDFREAFTKLLGGE